MRIPTIPQLDDSLMNKTFSLKKNPILIIPQKVKLPLRIDRSWENIYSQERPIFEDESLFF